MEGADFPLVFLLVFFFSLCVSRTHTGVFAVQVHIYLNGPKCSNTFDAESATQGSQLCRPIHLRWESQDDSQQAPEATMPMYAYV